jgi:hypothetical protein
MIDLNWVAATLATFRIAPDILGVLPQRPLAWVGVLLKVAGYLGWVLRHFRGKV